MRTTFPKLLKRSGHGVYFPVQANAVLAEFSFQAVCDRPGTVASNESGESFNDAVDRLTGQLEAQGYSQ